MASDTRLQVLITRGYEDPDLALLGLSTALVAASSNVDVTVFFTLRGTQWACRAQGDIASVERVRESIDNLRAAGARLECCSACLSKYCNPAAQSSEDVLQAGMEPAGLVSLVQRATNGASTLTF